MSHVTRFVEVSDRVWVARHDWFDLNITVIAGARGAVVVDTHASEPAARVVLDAVHRLGVGSLVAVVNTHEHFDHTFGNAVFADWARRSGVRLPIHAQVCAAQQTVASGLAAKDSYRAGSDPHREEVLAARIVPADRTFSTTGSLDLGDRTLLLRHVGRGHTSGDLVVLVGEQPPDARDQGVDVLVAGDLVEQSAPPAYGDDCHPLEWPHSVDRLLTSIGADTVVVPGHGGIVDRGFVIDQAAGLHAVADQITALEHQGLWPDEALAVGSWPWPTKSLRHAVRRGFDALR